jgi:hypothetical protein
VKTRYFVASSLLLSCLALTAWPQSDPQPKKQKSETYSALLYLPSGAGPRMVGAGATANLTINVNSYSSDAEAQQMAQTLLSGGQEAVRKELEKMKTIGRVSLVGRVGQFDLKLIRSRPLPEGGRRIVGVSDRPIQFLEAYHAGRSTDYDIGIIDLELKPGKKGKEEGQGVLIYAAKVKVLEGNKVEVENFGVEPAKLMGVRKL